MSQYNPYLSQQPMMNSPYQNGYSPTLSPQQRLMQMEQQYPQYAQQNQYMMPAQTLGSPQQPQGILGKIVNDFSEITANDVPMNGQAAFFPKADGSELQVRSWTANGTIQTVAYKPVLDQNQAEGANTPQMDFNALNEDVRALREDIKGVREMIEKSMEVSSPKSTRGKKAEVTDNE